MKKDVIVYTVDKKIVQAYENASVIEKLVMPDFFEYTMQSGTVFNKAELAYKKISLPIYRFSFVVGERKPFCDPEIEDKYASFDHELLELIGCLRSQKQNEISLAVDKATKPLYDKIQKLEGMSFWQKIKWSFRK